jgi:glycosyltransferase involved in cell wall biosynthesis
MPELILDKKTGFLVKNVDEAVEAVEDIYKISRLKCHQWSLQQFSQEKMVKEYIDLYSSILAKA